MRHLQGLYPSIYLIEFSSLSPGQEKRTKVIRLLAKDTIDEAVLVEQEKSLGNNSADPDLTTKLLNSLLRAHPVLEAPLGNYSSLLGNTDNHEALQPLTEQQ